MSLRPTSSLAPHAPPRHLVALVFLSLGIAGCGSNGLPDGQARSEAQPTTHTGAGSEQAEPAREAVAEVEDAEEELESAPPLTPVQRTTLPLITPITESMRANLRRIAARNADLRDDVFAKMGGSSIVSQAYLHCFAGPDVDLGPHGELAPTLDAFRAASVAGGNVFMRTSEAAGVGWSLRQGMTGRPSRVQREIRTLRPRFALAFFGGNDVQAMNPRVYARRLIALVEDLTEQGVIPILGAIQPRRSREMEPWVQRYNSITASVAQAFDLPYVDFHQAMLPLPGLGLAADGVHPNVFRRGPRMLPCDLTDEGLVGGHNIRNLLTLQVLHQVRQALDGPTGAARRERPPASPGRGHGDVSRGHLEPAVCGAPLPQRGHAGRLRRLRGRRCARARARVPRAGGHAHANPCVGGHAGRRGARGHLPPGRDRGRGDVPRRGHARGHVRAGTRAAPLRGGGGPAVGA
jgi:hypothetical protein